MESPLNLPDDLSFIDPDCLCHEGSVCIIYNYQTGKLIFAIDRMHHDLQKKHSRTIGQYEEQIRARFIPPEFTVQKIGVVSVWGSDKQIFDDYLREFVTAIAEEIEGIDSNTYINTLFETATVGDILGGVNQGGKSALTDQEQERYELAKQVHLLRGREKQDAMKQLGLGKAKARPYNQAMQAAGIPHNWQSKHFASSESNFSRKLARILIGVDNG